jgi:serine/threonine-protein kinase TTK/MPS1
MRQSKVMSEVPGYEMSQRMNRSPATALTGKNAWHSPRSLGDENGHFIGSPMSLVTKAVPRRLGGFYNRKPTRIRPGIDSPSSRAPSSGTSSSSSDTSIPANPPQPYSIETGPNFGFLQSNRVFVVNHNPYLALQKIGKGGSSKVYKVMTPNASVYALKRVDISQQPPAAVESFINEVKLLQLLQGSERIIGLKDSEVDENRQSLSIVLELGDIDLRSLIEKNRGSGKEIDPNFLRLMWQQMLEAVQIVHNSKVIHGDLKPANFLLVEGTLKLIDFGIAKCISRDTTNIERPNQVGTLSYMAPEALKMNEERQAFKVGRATDVWSLGCILYELVYNRQPFPQTDWLHKIQAIVDDSYEIQFQELPTRPDFDALRDVMFRCLQRDPKDRPRIDELLKHQFLTFAAADIHFVESQLLSFVLIVQDQCTDSQFDTNEEVPLLENIADQFRNGDELTLDW